MRAVLALSFSLATLLSGSVATSASAAGIEGTVYDTTCGAGCAPTCPPPPCRSDQVACPLQPGSRPLIACPQAETMPPLYSGDAGRAIVRRRGSGRVVAHKTVRSGSFRFHLAPGGYRVTVKVAEPCWRGQTVEATVIAGGFTPVSARVRDDCVMHPDRTGPG